MKPRRASRNLVEGVVRVASVLVGLVLAGVLLDNIMSLRSLPTSPWNLTGSVPVCFGIYLEVYATLSLWNYGGGTPHPKDPPRRLVTQGPYRFSRNPLYLARLLILFGLSVVLQSLGVLLVTLLLFLLVVVVILPREERRLETRFGEAYVEYRNRVARWIGPNRRP